MTMNGTVTITLRGMEPERLLAFVSTLINDTNPHMDCRACQDFADLPPQLIPYSLLIHEDVPMPSDEIRADMRDVLFTVEAALSTGITLRDKEARP